MEEKQYTQQEQEEFLNKNNSIDYWTILKIIKKVVPLYNQGLGLLVIDSLERLKTLRGILDE